MSRAQIHKLWLATKGEINTLIKKQNLLKNIDPLEKPMAFKFFSQLYILYAELVQKLAKIYNQTCQVQKREIVESLFKAASERLIELKNQLKSIELSEVVVLDDTLIKHKITPYDVEIWRSPQFLYRRPPEIENMLYDNLIFMNENERKLYAKKERQPLVNAVILVQAHERARQARVYLALIKYDPSKLVIHIKEETPYTYTHKPNTLFSVPVKRTIYVPTFIKPKPECEYLHTYDPLEAILAAEDEEEGIPLAVQEEAALVIQNAWRLYINRKHYREKKIFRDRLYGMLRDRKIKKPSVRRQAIFETYKREVLKKQLDEDYKKLIMSEHTRLLQLHKSGIMEDISDEIRDWFKRFYDRFEEFHPYPEILNGGTVLMVKDETMDYMEFKTYLDKSNMSKEDKKKQKEKEKLQKEKEKEKLQKVKAKEDKRRKKLEAAGVFDIAYEIENNVNLKQIEEVMKVYNNDWKNVDEYINRYHAPIKEWVSATEMANIHQELHALVDEYMILEYEMLRKALAADKKKKYKPQKFKKAKPPKTKKKKREPVDLSEGRTPESLFEELESNDMISKPSSEAWTDYIGEVNLIANDTRDENGLTTLEPRRGDMPLVLQEYLLGMGTNAVPKPKSLCLIGPTQCGKRFLINLIKSEIDAVIINLSPEKTYQYANNLNYLINIVMKVALHYQPVFILIENVHRVFWKKVPSEFERLEPRLLQNVLMKKIIKPLKKIDRVMILGTSDMPWTASRKLGKTFETFILIPRPDYSNAFIIWLNFLSEYVDGSQLKDSLVSALATVFQKYKVGDIIACIKSIMTIERRLEMHRKPLNIQEFITYFLDREDPLMPPEETEYDKFVKWFNQNNKLAKSRAAFKKKLADKMKKK